MSEEDDWFERALRDIDEESDRSVDGETTDGETTDDETTDDETTDGEGDEAEGDEATETEGVDDPDDAANAAGSDAGTTGEDRPGGDEDTPFGGVRDETDETEPDDAADESEPFGGGSFGDADPFAGGAAGDEGSSDEAAGDDSGTEFGDGDLDAPESPVPDEGSADPFGGAESGGGGDPFGGAGASDSFDGGSFGDDDPFGGYRGNASAQSDEPGFGEFDGGGGPGGGPRGETGFDVDPDEFESSIARTDVGIQGLDDMILGGVPRRSLLSVIGGAGTGKTTFALQFLNEALESDGKGVYITLEQTRESIFSTAEEKGWAFREAAAEDRLAVVAIDPIEMANSLASIRNDLTRLIAEFDADRLVLDSVSLLEMMYDHPAKRRSEVFGFTRSLKEAGVTTLLTSEASEENPYASRHGIVEYLTDAVFVLRYVRGSDFRETRLAVEIQKIRDANHSRETKPYEITDTGISVYGQANIF